jgi:hypothetical protein
MYEEHADTIQSPLYIKIKFSVPTFLKHGTSNKKITCERNHSALLQDWLKYITLCLTLDTKTIVFIVTFVATALNQFYTKEDSRKFLQSLSWLYTWLQKAATQKLTF